MVPSALAEGRSYLRDIQEKEEQLAINGKEGTCFITQNEGALKHLPTKSLNMRWIHRIRLMRLLIKEEKSLQKKEIRNYFRESFFQSTFWMIWSTHLSILSCLDLTGHYQYEAIYLPLYLFLQSQGVDFQFGIKIRNVETTVNQDYHTIRQLAVSQHGFDFKKSLGHSDIVIATPGSTVSGSAIGTNDLPPAWNSVQASDNLDANWALWLEAGNKYPDYGNPYTFCTRKSESMVVSFTVTTGDIGFVEFLQSSSQCTSQSGAIIFMKNSNWGLRLCLPVQPVFAQQPQNVRILWGFALRPENEGEHVKKNMLFCSGAEVMSEILHYLGPSGEMATEFLQRSITIPRAMPRMSSTLLTRSLEDRPCINPKSVVNLALVGPFVEVPWRTCVDTSYGVHTARAAVSRLMGLQDSPKVSSGPSFSRLLVTLLCK
ncbi:hypothetical protein N7499_012039 [Penicillium canescens]|uniref:Oleate hydratase n=1 Tax=Penicillium canescens TaxID=5083 RepID=A0AAD6ILD9_PENCN|nr:uncharacterized protein N7446_007314 [Penicillium canescens]KAJ6049355.1 hypothetical protein N7444_006071 [Penicillium canescens]KAJ6052672.1 hypothetical protein N7460_003206 [Penicillium canescens]KAJ6063194.1 hypothetical protein N7446_007314 [Penicillium canescens]KAJ6070152.1 hypothetical protein N7499_012039 [Penicillium canescens]KAJ6181797.1 hypothetical protein N7485_000439 [Penicillium canescens]